MEAVGLLLYLLQQLGMTLGVGASTFALTFYVMATRDGKVDESERRFMHAVYTVLRVGLFLIVSSGLAITAAHFLAGETGILTAPAFLFKWVLIGVLILGGILMTARILPAKAGGPVAGASWYALFMLHNTAPETSWMTLLLLYAAWIVIVTLGLELAKYLSRRGMETLMPAPVQALTVRYATPVPPVPPRQAAPIAPFPPRPAAPQTQPSQNAASPVPTAVHRQPPAQEQAGVSFDLPRQSGPRLTP